MDTSPHSAHRRAWDTLPWLVAGAASAEERAQALQHLDECADCRAELAFHQRVHAGLQAQGPAAHELPDAGAAFQRLAARLDVADADLAPPAPGPNPPADSASATAGANANARSGGGAAPWTRWLVAAVLVQAVGLGAAGLVLLQRGHDAEYQTLSQPAAAPRAATLRLAPAPGMDFGALRGLLTQTRMDVVEVASDGSHLGLAPRDGRAATSAAALPVLRGSALVLLAEPAP